MIVRARFVVTMNGAPIENGAVAISGQQIVDVGTSPEIRTRNAGHEIIDLGEQALIPGLINAHCHLDYTCLRGTIPPPQSFTDWIRAINTAKAALSPGDYVASINDGFVEARRFGTTTIANLTAFPELIPKVKAPIRTCWFAELIDVRNPTRADEIVNLAIESLKQTQNRGLAPHALFTASANLFRRCDEIAREKQVLLTTHLAESREETSMFRHRAGPLYEFLKEMGRRMDDCGRNTPVGEFIGRLGTASLPGRWILVHLNELAEGDSDLLASLATKFHIVHCPRSHQYFGHSPFQVEELCRLGFNICLGTDSLASNDDLNLFAEMRAFQKEFPGVSPKEIFEMVTTNPAHALGQANVLGRICSGSCTDLIAIPCEEATEPDRVFEEILGFSQPVTWMMISGKTQTNPSS
jgi:cytosine/adenosine deaminase-related metal-dependent hydrolase